MQACLQMPERQERIQGGGEVSGMQALDKDGWIKRLFTGDIFKSEIAKNIKYEEYRKRRAGGMEKNGELFQ